MRIFHINMHRQWGGQPNRVLTTALGLRELGHDVVIAGPRNCVLVQRAKAAGLETFDDLELISGFRPGSMWRDVKALKAHLLQKSYDVIDTHGSQDTWRIFLALLFQSKTRRPVFIRSRHNIFPVSGGMVNRWLYSHIDHVITVSPQVIPQLARVMPPERCTTIYSAPDIKRFMTLDAEASTIRDTLRHELGLVPEDHVIGVVGRLAPEKGHVHLIAAAPAIAAAIPTVKFVFAGQGRSKAELESRIAALGPDMARRFQLLGFREDIPQLLRTFDVFVLPSIEGESLGTSILEAFMAERPVVSTDVGGTGESVIDGVTGRLVKPGDSRALAVAIIDLLKDPAMATDMALKGRSRVEELFSPARIAKNTEEVYRSLLKA